MKLKYLLVLVLLGGIGGCAKKITYRDRPFKPVKHYYSDTIEKSETTKLSVKKILDYIDIPDDENFYIVRSWKQYGDCLWNIAIWEYNDAWQWKKIYKANNIDDPNVIEIGQELIIP